MPNRTTNWTIQALTGKRQYANVIHLWDRNAKMCVQNIYVVQDKTGEKRIKVKVYGPHGGGRVPRCKLLNFPEDEHAIANSDYLQTATFFLTQKINRSQGQHDDSEGSVIIEAKSRSPDQSFPIPAGSVKSEVEFRDTAVKLALQLWPRNYGKKNQDFPSIFPLL